MNTLDLSLSVLDEIATPLVTEDMSDKELGMFMGFGFGVGLAIGAAIAVT